MLCAVLGIAPPLDDSTRKDLYEKAKELASESGERVRVRWNSDTIQGSWVVPDPDTDVPTTLISAYLWKDDNEEERNAFGNHGNDIGVTPEDLASLIQSELDEDHSCEVWASAPAPLPLMRFEANTETDPSDNSEELLSDFCQKGLCLLPNVLHDASALSQIRSMVDDAIRDAETAIATNHPTIRIGEDDFLFREIASRSKHRFDLLIANDTDLYRLVRNQVFSETSLVPELLQRLFSGNKNGSTVEWEVDLSVVYSKPGANHQGWHADGGHLEEGNCDNALALPYAICLFVPLIDLDNLVGFTQFWPGSHRYKELVGFGPFAEVAAATWDGVVPVGKAIVYDYRLLHRGMPNASTNNRAVLQLLCRKSWYQEKNNYGKQSIYEGRSKEVLKVGGDLEIYIDES